MSGGYDIKTCGDPALVAAHRRMMALGEKWNALDEERKAAHRAVDERFRPKLSVLDQQYEAAERAFKGLLTVWQHRAGEAA